MTLTVALPVLTAAPSVDTPQPFAVRTKRRRSRWPWVVAVVAYAQYCVVATWLMLVRHYAIGDALSRTATAKIMVLSRDPHLAAMGYYWMPLPTISRVPFVLLLQPFGHAELAGPASSAMFAALTIPVLCAIGRVLSLSTAMTATIVGIFALNPVTIYIACNAMSESAFGFFLALSLYGYLRWRHDGAVTSLAILGLALGGAMTCRYEALVLAPMMAIAVMLAVPKERRLQSASLVVLPTAVVFFLWSVNSQLIQGDWLFWKHGADPLIATPKGATWLPASKTFLSIFRHNAFTVLALAPAVVFVLFICFVFFRRWRTSVGVLGMILFIPGVVTWQTYQGTSYDVPRFFVLTPMFVTIGVMWAIRAARGRQSWATAVCVVSLALLALGSLTGTLALADVRRTSVEGEFVFFNAILGRDLSPEEIADAGGQSQYPGDLSAYREIDTVLTPSFEAGKRVAMDSIIALPFLVSDHPSSFIIPEDRDFESILSDPIGRVDFILTVSTSRASGYEIELEKIVQQADGGTWVNVGSFAFNYTLWEWVPTGEKPTVTPVPPASPAPPTSAPPASPTSLAPASP